MKVPLRATAALLAVAATASLALPAAAQTPAEAPKVWNPPNIYPDLSVAPPQDVADAERLWTRSKRIAKQLFPTVAAARKRGYKGHIKHIHRPKPFFFHLRKPSLHKDGRVLDPRRPEAIVYWYDPPRPMVMVAFMYRVEEGKEPAYARTVLPWHSHCDGWSVVMHTWFTNDLRSGIARRPPRPEFSTAFNRDFGDPTPDVASGCIPNNKDKPKHHGQH